MPSQNLKEDSFDAKYDIIADLSLQLKRTFSNLAKIDGQSSVLIGAGSTGGYSTSAGDNAYPESNRKCIFSLIHLIRS